MIDANYLAPRFLISVEGTKLKTDITAFVRSVTYEEGDDVVSSINIDLKNPEFRFNDDKVFLEGNKVDLWMGYSGTNKGHGKLTFMNRCTIMKPNPVFPRGSQMPSFNVEARHAATEKLMNDEPTGKRYVGLIDSKIVERIYNFVGVASFLIDTPKRGPKAVRLRKKGMSFWKFIQYLARVNGYVVDVRYDMDTGSDLGYFGPSEGSTDQKFTFTYGTGESDATLLEFQPDFSLPASKSKIEVTFIDPKTRKTRKFEIEADRREAEEVKYVGPSGARKAQREVRNGPSIILSAFGERIETVADRRFRSVADAKRFVSAWWARREREFIFGRGVVVGEPTLRRGQVHRLVLPDKRLTGDWRLTSVRHSMSPGQLYETEFTATKVVLGSKVGDTVSSGDVTVSEKDQ